MVGTPVFFTRIALLAALASASWAQDPYGRIAGRVVDSTGAAVPGARVHATNIDTNVVTNAATDAQGNYEARNLISGPYRLTVEMQGFKTHERGPLEVRVGDQLTLNVALELGDLSERVTVSAEAPLLETAGASMGQVIDRRRLLDLPMPFQSTFYLNQLTPGVITSNPPTGNWQINQPGAVSGMAVNGAGTTSSEFVIDGSPNHTRYGVVNYQPPPEMLQEVRVQTAAFDASVGHFTGAQVNMVTKSGTNELHGNVTYSHNSRPLNTRSFFANRSIYDTRTGPVTQAKIDNVFPDSRMNRIRATVSGPFYLPKLYNGRNRTFFTAGYDRFQRDLAQPVRVKTVPTPEQRAGDFSGLLRLGAQYQIYDPATIAPAPGGRFSRMPLPGNVVPASRIVPAAKQLLDYFPLPNATGTSEGLNNFGASPVNHPVHLNGVIRVDHVVSPSHRFFLSVLPSHEDTKWQAGQWPDPRLGQVNNTPAWNVIFDDVIMLRPDTVLDLRYGLCRVRVDSLRRFRDFDLKSLGLPDSLTGKIDTSLAALPLLTFTAYSELSQKTGSRNVLNTQSFVGSLAHNRSNHSLRVGGEYRDYRKNLYDYGSISPAYQFNPTWTRGPLDNSPAAPIGQDLATFLLGLPSGGGIDRNAALSQQSGYLGVFFQDDWKLTRKLMLNLGLRYELEPASTERYNRANRGFDFTTANPIQAAAQANYARNPIPEIPASAFRTTGGLLFAGEGGVPRALWRESNNWSPRIGLAYQIRSSTVLRAGYGIFFETLGADRFDMPQQGFSRRSDITPSLDNGLTFRASVSNPFPDGVLEPVGAADGLTTFLGRGVSIFWPERRAGYMQRWSFNVQQEFPKRVLVEAAYIGNRGTGLNVAENLNAVPAQFLSRSPARDDATNNYLTAAVQNPFFGLPEFAGSSLQGRTVARSQLLRPYPQFANVNTNLSSGFSWYHALQIRAEKRFSDGYTIQAGYTWSKFMEAVEKLNDSDLRPHRVISSMDRPHNLVVSGLYEIPVGKGKRWLASAPGWVDHLAGGWSLQAIYHAQSGRPLQFGNVFFNGDLHDLVLPRSERTVDRWFNTAAGFESDPRKQPVSNIRAFPLRFTGLRSDGWNAWDASLLKNFSLTERVKFQLRAEAADALNHALFSDPNTNPASSLFGQVSEVEGSGQRMITVGARLTW